VKVTLCLRARRQRACRSVTSAVDGRLVYPWRAVDAEGEGLDVLVQTRRNKRAAFKLMRKLLKKYAFVPDKPLQMTSNLMGLQPVILGSQNAISAVDGATIERRIRISQPDEGRGRCKGSRAWDPRKGFLSMHEATHNTFNVQRHLTSAGTHRAFPASAVQTWREIVAAGGDGAAARTHGRCARTERIIWSVSR
jgi:putative transposase